MAITTKCTHKCPGDKECTCNGLVRHAHHICRDVPRLRRLEEGTSASPLP